MQQQPGDRTQEDDDELLEDNAQAGIPGNHVVKEATAALWLCAGAAATAFPVFFVGFAFVVDRLEVVLEETLRALGKRPVFFVRPPFVKAFAMDPLASAFAETGCDHGFRAVFLQTNPAHLFIAVVVVVECASMESLISWCSNVELAAAVAPVVGKSAAGLERSRLGTSLLEITHRRCCFEVVLFSISVRSKIDLLASY